MVEYGELMSERGKRGLEGLAVRVRDLAGGVSRIAVLWEGGYPAPLSKSSSRLDFSQGSLSKPFVLVHDLELGAMHVKMPLSEALSRIQLEVPRPQGQEPQAPEGGWEWGFMVFLSWNNSQLPPKFLHHWLQRFDESGLPLGVPIDLKEQLPSSMGRAKGEGMSWFETGQSVVLVHEAEKGARPNAFILRVTQSLAV